MWSDTYCYEAQCGASAGGTPVGAALFAPWADSSFARSIGGMIWPCGDAWARNPFGMMMPPLTRRAPSLSRRSGI